METGYSPKPTRSLPTEWNGRQGVHFGCGELRFKDIENFYVIMRTITQLTFTLFVQSFFPCLE